MTSARTPGARPVDDEDAILARDRQLVDGLLAADVAALDAVLAPDFVAVHITGQEQSRADWLSQIGSGRMAYHAFDPESARVTVDGDDAVLVTRNRVVATIGGSRGRWPLESTSRYVRCDGRWMLRRSAASTY
ncbi:MAG: nuclear transport factor 2 family protein [Microbacteriaceae bacterium]|nr:nuclear transport factor 2 family protein [Microbacteriaceae bacterium]